MLPESTKDEVKFESSVLGTFSTNLFIPPNTINFADVFGNFGAKLADSPVVLAVIVTLYALFILAAVFAYRADRRDARMVSNHSSFLGLDKISSNT